jgi:polyisoprenoid-binding protein YceI
MKKAVVFFWVLMETSAHAQYKPVDNGSSVKFTIKNFGFGVDGSFTGLTGSIRFDPARPADATFDVSIDANTVNTDNTMRDDHLRQTAYFDVKAHPHIRLLSDKISNSNKKGVFLFTGKLTIKNQTKPISFPFTVDHSDGQYQFKGVFSVNRKDFDIGGTSTISDNLEVTLDVIAKEQ